MKERIIKTLPNRLIGLYRIVLGTIFSLVGSLKLIFNDFQHAWSIQLTEIKIPYCILFFWMTPMLEILAGIALILGYLSRVAAFAVLPIMAGAIYAYYTIINREAFLAQPQEAFLPAIMIMLATMVLIYGGGSWSIDLKLSYKK